MVASLREKDWLAQAKYDGWRVQAYFDSPEHVRCFTKSGNPMNEAYSSFQSTVGHLIEQLGLPTGTVLDAEFVGPRGHLDPAIYIFDMLAWDGEWLVNEPYETRWERCKNLILPTGDIHLAETVEGGFIDFFERLKASWDGKSITLWEGIVVKARKGKLKLDRRKNKKSDVMYKIKYRDIVAAR